MKIDANSIKLKLIFTHTLRTRMRVCLTESFVAITINNSHSRNARTRYLIPDTNKRPIPGKFRSEMGNKRAKADQQIKSLASPVGCWQRSQELSLYPLIEMNKIFIRSLIFPPNALARQPFQSHTICSKSGDNR